MATIAVTVHACVSQHAENTVLSWLSDVDSLQIR